MVRAKRFVFHDNATEGRSKLEIPGLNLSSLMNSSTTQNSGQLQSLKHSSSLKHRRAMSQASLGGEDGEYEEERHCGYTFKKRGKQIKKQNFIAANIVHVEMKNKDPEKILQLTKYLL